MTGAWLLGAPPSSAQSPAGETNALDDGWLAAVNFHRAAAGLPPVAAVPAWQGAIVEHGRYMVLNNEITHHPDPSKPGYTDAGAQAAAESNLFLTPADWPAVEHIEGWMASPFHGLGILRPALVDVAYGAYRDPLAQPWGAGAGLNVLRGLEGSSLPPSSFPVMWPGDGATVPTTASSSDHTGCPDMALEGPPLRVFLDPEDETTLADSRIEHDGEALAHCAVDYTSWHHPDAAERSAWRPQMRRDGLLMLTPAQPLEHGESYDVSVTLDTGEELAWSFSVRPAHEIAAHPEPPVWGSAARVVVDPVPEGFDGRTFTVQWPAAHSAPGYELLGYELAAGGQVIAQPGAGDTTAVAVMPGGPGEVSVAVTAERRFTGDVEGPATTVRLPPTFVDVAAGHPHQQGIYWSAWKGIAAGFADGTFQPGSSTTRGQMATFLARALDLPPAELPGYDDVGLDHAHAQAIASLTAAGIAAGYPDGTFRPGTRVTRAQMATFLARGLDLPPGAGSPGFPDVPPGAVHADAIARLAASGITAGYPDGTFRPAEPVTRGQMATFMHRARAYLPPAAGLDSTGAAQQSAAPTDPPASVIGFSTAPGGEVRS